MIYIVVTNLLMDIKIVVMLFDNGLMEIYWAVTCNGFITGKDFMLLFMQI